MAQPYLTFSETPSSLQTLEVANLFPLGETRACAQRRPLGNPELFRTEFNHRNGVIVDMLGSACPLDGSAMFR